ncbi:hypothetical protein D3C76_1258930 [compost metagenome]
MGHAACQVAHHFQLLVAAQQRLKLAHRLLAVIGDVTPYGGQKGTVELGRPAEPPIMPIAMAQAGFQLFGALVTHEIDHRHFYFGPVGRVHQLQDRDVMHLGHGPAENTQPGGVGRLQPEVAGHGDHGIA